MAANRHFYLCGGVLFFLLKQTAIHNGTARDHRNGIKDGHSSPALMQDLIYTFTGSQNYGAEKDTSQYRECLSEGSVNIPFNDLIVIMDYDNTVKNKYPDALNRMSEFVQWHINPGMKDWLVKALLDIIEKDDDIKDDDILYIRSDGQPVAKSLIRTIDHFELQPFLVGVLHYIIYHRHGQNMRGANTLDAIGTKNPRKERVYSGHLGENLSREVVVDLYESPVSPEIADMDTFVNKPVENESVDHAETSDAFMKSSKTTADSLGHAEHQSTKQNRHEQKYSGMPEEETEYAETDAADGCEDTSNADEESNKSTIIQQQANVIQNGNHNVNLTNNGTMNFNF